MMTGDPGRTVVAPTPRGRSVLLARHTIWLVFDSPLFQLLAVVALYSFSAFLFLRSVRVTDPDIWWHLATGRWILQHHTVPMTDPFSSYGLGKPWIAYSWVFGIAVQLLQREFGYMGIVLYEVAVRLALTGALFCLLRSLLPSFWRAAGLTAIGIYAMNPIIGPRPGMLTILITIIELNLLLSARRTGTAKKLWLLPFLYVLWANWHIQFVYGLVLLAVFAAEPLLAWIWRETLDAARISFFRSLWFVLLASFLATLVNPFGVRIYSTVLQYMQQPKVYNLVSELKAMTFREPQFFVVLSLALGAAMAIGWRRETRLLWPVLLSIASFVAFKSVKEIWFLIVISSCAISDGWAGENVSDYRRGLPRNRLIIPVWVLAVLVVGYRRYNVSNAWLEMQVAGNFPEVASQYIEKHHLRGPLFNDFNWGGFLIWRLPELPVAIDGRTNVHGDERVAHFSAVWNGKAEWAVDPELRQANVVLANKASALASLLRMDPQFKIVSEDIQAIVFQRR